MTRRKLALSGGVGGIGVLLGLASAGVEPFTAVVIGFLAFVGGLDPNFAEGLSLASISIPSAGIASDALAFLPALKMLPAEILNPVIVFILVVAVAGLVFRYKGED